MKYRHRFVGKLAVLVASGALWVAVAAGPANGATAEAPPLFIDVADQAHVAVPHHPAVFDMKKLGHIMPMVTAGASGGAVADYNHDGWLDIFVNDSKTGTRNHLFRNNGDMTFTDVAEAAGVANMNDDLNASSMGLFFDYDGDGWEDLLIVRLGTQVLMKNMGDGTFKDVTVKAGLNKHINALAAIAFDYNGDGYVDLYFGAYYRDIDMFDIHTDEVLHESFETARNGGANVLFRNNGDGTFTDVTKEAGVGDTGWTIAVAHGDYDNDGLPDIYVANDYGPDKLFRNTGHGSFKDVTEKAIGVDTKKGMNAEFGDFNNDGYLDVFVTNITEEWLVECNMLWQNSGHGTFTDVSKELHVCETGWGWGGKFLDYDNDGDLDLYTTNGFLTGKGNYLDDLLPALYDSGENPSNPAKWPDMKGRGIAAEQKNVLFTNLRGTTFVRAENSGVDVARDSRAILLGDFDNDGRVDMFVTNNDLNAMLFHNEVKNSNHWTEIVLKGKAPNNDAVGARLTLTLKGQKQIREVNIGNGFGGASMLRQNFGLGKADSIDQLDIHWPYGDVQTFKNIPADRIIRIEQGKSGYTLVTAKGKSK